MRFNINNLKGKKILVVGDIMLDTYHIGDVKRISPEAPVPVVRVKKSYSVLGAAANVARNLMGLGSTPAVVGICGKDDSAAIMQSKFETLGIEVVLEETNYPTVTKTRVIGNDQQVVRIDFEDDNVTMSSETEHNIIAAVERLVSATDVVVISDYNKGVCTKNVCQNVIKLAQQHGKMVIVDPKGCDWDKYRDASIITPNIKELSDVWGVQINNEDEDIYAAAREVIKKFNLTSLIVTRSEKGISYVDEKGAFSIPTEAKEVFDVSGAGDTVVATLAASLAAKYEINNAIYIANKAAGVVVGKMGTSPILFDELQAEMLFHNSDNKLIPQSKLSSISYLLKMQNRKIVFTNGCFDILHKGHVVYLEKAKQMGDVLILGLNSDSSVKRLKGESRPINSQDARATVMAALECVDYVVIFDDDTPLEVIKNIEPDILVKGGDYKIEDIVGREYAKETKTISFVEGFSTTSTIAKMG